MEMAKKYLTFHVKMIFSHIPINTPAANYGHRVKWSILLSENRLLTILMCGTFPMRRFPFEREALMFTGRFGFSVYILRIS